MLSNEIILTLVLGVVCLTVLDRVFGRRLPPSIRRVLQFVTALEIGLVILHFIVWKDTTPRFALWFFDLGSEFALGATLSAVQLLLVGLVALMIALRKPMPNRWHRLFWLGLALMFVGLNLDEYYLLHDDIPEFLFIGLAGIAIVTILGGLWLTLRQQRWLLVMILTGFGAMGTAIVLDAVLPHRPAPSALEEFLEMNGVTLVLVAFLAYARLSLGEADWRRNRLIMIAGALVWAAWLLGSFWLLPAVEHRLRAVPVQVEFLDGDIALIGYTAAPDTVQPGSTLNLTLYWRITRPVPHDYGVSVHVLSHPDIQSLAQNDHLLIRYFYTSAWVPGAVVRLPVQVQLPADLAVPASYWLQLNLWQSPWWDFNNAAITAHDSGWLLAPDTLILTSVSALPDDMPPPPDLASNYQVGNALTLYGYALPATVTAENTLPIRFWWETTAAVGAELTQYVHLFHENSDDVFVFDHQPFDGSFPLVDWPAHTNVVDEWTIALPDDLPPGDYAVYTGLFENSTQARQPVTNADGEPVQDNSILLGTIHKP